jgi:hypothetical protein
VALPGFGLSTPTEKLPAAGALPLAASCVDDTNVVANGDPANITCAPLTKPLPFTVIVNAPEENDDGVTLVSTGDGFHSVTAPLPDAAASAELTAPTLTVLNDGTLTGAVYIPEEFMIPVDVLPPVTPLTCQLTEGFEDPLTVAVNFCVKPARTLALLGETETAMPDGARDEDELPIVKAFLAVPVQPTRTAAMNNVVTIEYRT